MQRPQFAVFPSGTWRQRPGSDPSPSTRGAKGSGLTPAFPGVSEWRVEDAEPAAQVLLDRELLLELRLQLELLGVVALLVVARWDEGPERAALVPVDPVHGLL